MDEFCKYRYEYRKTEECELVGMADRFVWAGARLFNTLATVDLTKKVNSDQFDRVNRQIDRAQEIKQDKIAMCIETRKDIGSFTLTTASYSHEE